jgi:hypothetical protein
MADAASVAIQVESDVDPAIEVEIDLGLGAFDHAGHGRTHVPGLQPGRTPVELGSRVRIFEVINEYMWDIPAIQPCLDRLSVATRRQVGADLTLDLVCRPARTGPPPEPRPRDEGNEQGDGEY